jgi:Cu-processing system permease protein
MDASNILTLAQKELRDSLRNRWFLLYTAAFISLTLALSALALSGSDIAGFAGFGRTAASLVNLVMLIVPLMALTTGAQSLAGEQERGSLVYLLAQPVNRAEVLLGKYLGLALALLAALTLGFGSSGLVIALSGGDTAEPGVYLQLVLLAFLLALVMLSVGFLISAFSRKASVAVGVSLFLWLVFVFFGDLGLMGAAVALKARLAIGELFALSLINPLQVFKMAAVLDIHTTLDILGPAGIYAVQTYRDSLMVFLVAILSAWAILTVLLAYVRFSTKGDL